MTCLVVFRQLYDLDISRCSRYSNESNQKAIRDRSSKVEMLDKLGREVIYLNSYSRYMDDISIIVDVINKEDKGRIFMRLKPELENLDPVYKSIQVTGKEVYVDNIVEERGGTEEQGLEYLDIWQELKREPKGHIMIEFSIYRKKSESLCSTEEGYSESCERLRKALETRGYNKNEKQGEKRGEGGRNSGKSKAGHPGIPVVVPDK